MRPAMATFLRNPTKFKVLTGNYRPPQLARVQTDGSFNSQIARTAVILIDKQNEEHNLYTTYLNHRNSMESEACSILDGIQYSIYKDEGSVELENDCLGVVNNIIHRRAPKKSYLADYYYAIFREIRHLDYFGIRWIPRELNSADDLFRI
jgi:hypothetical protein